MTIFLIFDWMVDWIYQQIVGALGEFFGYINLTSAELFKMPWVLQIVRLFQNIGWALFITGIIVGLFEFAIESQNGRGDPKAFALNIIKGFFAVNLFCVVPVQLYNFAVILQSSLSSELTGNIYSSSGSLAQSALNLIGAMTLGPIISIVVMVMMGYAVIKVFFSSIKRGGILLIQISVGSLYMFSVPRGYTDGFYMWIKQVIATCFTAFMQSTMLICGLLLFKDYWLLGLGVMLAASEIPRIAGMFGLETGTRPNINGAISTAQHAVNLSRVIKAIPRNYR